MNWIYLKFLIGYDVSQLKSSFLKNIHILVIMMNIYELHCNSKLVLLWRELEINQYYNEYRILYRTFLLLPDLSQSKDGILPNILQRIVKNKTEMEKKRW